MVKALGYNWVRLHDAGWEYTGWWWLERTPGTWTFRDDAIRRYRDQHLTILGQLGTAPTWASAAGRFAGQQVNGVPVFDRVEQAVAHAGPIHASVVFVPAPLVRQAAIDAFHTYLIDRHVTVITRDSRGGDISAACGQLKGKLEKK